MQIFTETIAIIRARRVPGEYGGWELDWDAPEVIPVEFPVSVQPLNTSTLEEGPSRHAVTATHALYTMPPYLLDELRDTDRVRVAGWPFDLTVEGKPAHWRTQHLAHTEVDLKETHG